MTRIITCEEAETFFKFFYIATCDAPYHKNLYSTDWNSIDDKYRAMRHEFFDGELCYENTDRSYELDYEQEYRTGHGLITTTAYGVWIEKLRAAKAA